DLVYMGTRFIPTHESVADPLHKRHVVDAAIDDLIVSAGISGAPASWIKGSLREAGYDPDNLPAKPPAIDANAGDRRRWKQIFSAGQGVGASKSIEAVGAIVDQVEREF